MLPLSVIVERVQLAPSGRVRVNGEPSAHAFQAWLGRFFQLRDDGYTVEVLLNVTTGRDVLAIAARYDGGDDLSAWKSAELEVCRALGAERTGPVGRDGPDCTTAARWAVQVKRSSHVGLSGAWLEQAKRDAANDPGRRPWLLVTVFPRGRGRAHWRVATLSGPALTAELRLVRTFTFQRLEKRSVQTPYLSRADLERLEGDPSRPLWALEQRSPSGYTYTIPFRAIAELDQLARARIGGAID